MFHTLRRDVECPLRLQDEPDCLHFVSNGVTTCQTILGTKDPPVVVVLVFGWHVHRFSTLPYHQAAPLPRPWLRVVAKELN